MSKHSQHPWVYDPFEGQVVNINLFDSVNPRQPVLIVPECDDPQETDANGYLAAAAPELLEACRAALEDCENDNWENSDLAIQLRSAIAKATSEKSPDSHPSTV